MNYSSHISAINELAATEGIFTAGQAKRFGIPNDALSHACQAGRLDRIAKGAYRLTGSQPTRFDELSAVWKLTAPDKMSHERIPLSSWDGIAIGGTTAASLLGIGDFYLSPYRILASRRINSRNTSVRFGIRKIARLDVSFIEGLPVTRIERTLLDLCVDKEDPSLVVNAFSDAINKYVNSVNCEHLESLFINTMRPDKGRAYLDSLFADARIKRNN
jgi:predicted transcriptional regulator of viral defense system